MTDLERLRGFAKEVIGYYGNPIRDGVAMEMALSHGLVDENRVLLPVLTGENDKKPTRSYAQNRTLHAFHQDQEKTTVNEYAGRTAKEWKDIMKYEILWDMYINYDIKKYSETIFEMTRHYTKRQYDDMRWKMIQQGWITTHDLPVAVFTEYLASIEDWCHARGILLRSDMNLYRIAMGMK